MSVYFHYRLFGDGPWHKSSDCTSVDTAKARCKQIRDGGRNSLPRAEFVIVVDGRPYLKNDPASGWRIRWIDATKHDRTHAEAAEQ